MKKIIIILIALWSNVNIIRAQGSEQQIRQKIDNVASNMKTMQCDFVQTKNLKMLNNKMVSKGIMFYQQSNKLRWEYKSPYKYTFILNGSQVLLKNEKRTDVINVQQNKIFKEIARIMMNSVVGKCLSDTKDFNVKINATSTEWVATLIPLRKDMRAMFPKIVLHFDKSKSMVKFVELFEKNGDLTVIELKNVIINKPINANVFSVN